MTAKLFVGNFPFSTTEDDLINLFSEYGVVQEATIVLDKETSRSRGFGFVTMMTKEDAGKAREALSGFGLGGRKLVVDDARERAR